MTFPEFLERKFLEWQQQQGRRQTIADFAGFLGVSQAVVSMWLNGSRKPNVPSVQLLAREFGLEVYDALGLPRPDESLHYLQQHWDDLPPEQQRAQFPVTALWWPLIDFEGFALLETHHVVASRTKYLRDDLRELCERADLPYLSPHKFRHGHVMWARRHARDMDDLKAISQNVMHSSVTITDGVYGNFDGADVKNIIARLGQSPAGDGIEHKLDELLGLLRASGKTIDPDR